MKVLHIVAGDLGDGAARGAYWLHLGLKDLGIESKILTNSRNTLGDSDVITIAQSPSRKLFDLIRKNLDPLLLLFYKKRQKRLFSSGFFGYNFLKTKEYQEAQIIHLHWINGGFVNLRNLSQIPKPVVWTMRDMWPLTGGCHYSIDCPNYKSRCGSCKQLKSRFSFDLSWLVWRRKQRYLPHNIQIVCISNWLYEIARESALFRGFPIKIIPNNVNTQDFFPIEKDVAKQVLGLHTAKKIILTGCTNAEDFYKGFDKFIQALGQLDKKQYFLCFFGNIDKKYLDGCGFEYKSFGYLHDNTSLRLLYSAADVFVAPSMMEAFGKTIVEAMACGTPVVCFDATGPRDIVSHGVDGYKAIPFDSTDFAKGIEWVLHSPDYQDMCKNAQEKATMEYDSTLVAKKYVELYEKLLSSKTRCTEIGTATSLVCEE